MPRPDHAAVPASPLRLFIISKPAEVVYFVFQRPHVFRVLPRDIALYSRDDACPINICFVFLLVR